jgi:hypothetical protein
LFSGWSVSLPRRFQADIYLVGGFKMPPIFSATMNVTPTDLGRILAGQWGNGPLRTLYTVGAAPNFALAFVNNIAPENENTPAYIINLGSGAYYIGGVIHDLPGQTHIEPGHGELQDRWGSGLLINAGETITVQLANSGSFILGMVVYEFSPVAHSS